jgi:hypothetical protein
MADGGKNKKYGRNKKEAARYVLEKRLEKNKERRIKRHIKRMLKKAIRRERWLKRQKKS